MLAHRLQLLLDEDQYRELEAEAKRCHSSVAGVIREAIDYRLNHDLRRRQAAIDRILAMAPVPVPADPRELRREVDEEHERKFPGPPAEETKAS